MIMRKLDISCFEVRLLMFDYDMRFNCSKMQKMRAIIGFPWSVICPTFMAKQSDYPTGTTTISSFTSK